MNSLLEILTPVAHNHLVHHDHHEYDIHLVHLEDHVHDEQLVHLEDHLHQRARGPLSSVMFASVDVDNLPCVSISFYLEIIRVSVSFYLEIIRVCVSFYLEMLVLEDTCQQQLTNKIIQQQNVHKMSIIYSSEDSKCAGFIGPIYHFQFCSDTIYIWIFACSSFYVAFDRILMIADWKMASF